MSQEGVYSENKLLYWYAQDGGLPAAPKQVRVVLSDLCNQDCSFCAFRVSGYSSNELFVSDSPVASYGHDNPKRLMPTPRALDLMDEMKAAGVLSVQFTGGGEPTVHPEHEDIFSHTLNAGLRCALVSNGVKWSEHLTFHLLPRFDWVRVSIDAGNAKSYARIRNAQERHWNQAWTSVSWLASAIEKLETATVLGVGFVVTPENFEEIPAFALKAKESGAHNARITAMFGPEGEEPFLETYEDIARLIGDARDSLQSSNFTIYDNFGARFDDLKQHSPDYSFCSYQYYAAFVGGDMKAYRCCALAYNKRGLVTGGDLRERGFDEFWESRERENDMMRFDSRGCERCPFNTKNRQLLYVMGEPPHKEWP